MRRNIINHSREFLRGLEKVSEVTMNISEFYGKKVVSDGGKTGYVVSVNGGAGRIECLVCADSDEKEFTVDARDVISVGNNIVYEDRERAIKAARPIRLGRAGFDEYGTFLGTVEDMEFRNGKLLKTKIGKKSYPADKLIYGDVIIVRGAKMLKSDVVKDGKVLIKKGTPVTDKVLEKAAENGEYVQTSLKSL